MPGKTLRTALLGLLLALTALIPAKNFAEDSIDEAVKDEAESFWTPDVKTSTKLMLKIGKMIITAPEVNNPAPVPDAAAKKNGFILFKRALSEPINYNTNPRKEEVNPPAIELLGCPGEALPFLLGIFPLAEGTVSASISDLTGASGIVVAKDNVELRSIKHMLKQGSMACVVMPEISVKESEFKLKPGITRPVLSVLQIPVEAKPGSYKGTLSFKSKGGLAEVTIKLEVLPFKLEISPSMTFGWAMGPKDEKTFGLFKELGCNSVSEGLEPLVLAVSGGSVKLDFSKADKMAALIKKYGMADYEQRIHSADVGNMIAQSGNLPELSSGYLAAYKDAIMQIQDWKKDRGIKAAYWIADRVFNKPPYPGNKSMEYCMKVLKTIREIPGVRIGVNPTSDGDGETQYAPMVAELDIAGLYSDQRCKKVLAAGRTKGNIDLYDAGRSRIAWGFLPWKHRAVGRTELSFMGWDEKVSRSPKSASSSVSSFAPCGIAYPEKDSFNTTTAFELVREGINDYRYIYTLELLISAAAKDKNKEENALAERAKAVLETIREKIPEYSAEAGKIDGQCGEWRKRIIEEVKKLRKL